MKIAISGIGKMGAQIAQKLLEAGHEIIVHDINRAQVDTFVAANPSAQAAYDKADVAAAFTDAQPIVWLMIPAHFINTEIALWTHALPANTILIDGGNSDYRGDPARAQIAKQAGSTLLDVGTSGGIWGYERGFSFMIGGDKTAYMTLIPVFDALAAPGGGHDHFGNSGAGHYVKMVHNAIEYGMMESLAEGYRMLKEGPYPSIDLASAGDVWEQNSVISSWLNDLTREIVRTNPELEDIDGVVLESGETRWALETAAEHNIALPAIQAALNVRLASQTGTTNFATKLLAAQRNAFGGHNIPRE